LWFGNLDSGLQVKEKTVSYRRVARTSKLLKLKNEIREKNVGNTNNFGKIGQKHVEMVWTCSTHGG
jgi:hypothetical protein